MNEQYDHDARLDAVSIQQWRDKKRRLESLEGSRREHTYYTARGFN